MGATLTATVEGASCTLDVVVAGTFWSRSRGLLGRCVMGQAEGLLLTGCSAVHTCFMAFAIDVVYLDRDLHVTKIVRGLSPWRVSVGGGRARHTLELPAGAAERAGLEVGGRVAFRAQEPSVLL